MKDMELYNGFKTWLGKSIYGLIVAILTIAILVIAPFISGGTEANLELLSLSTAEEWMIYLTPKILTAMGNMAATICFINQGELNVKDNQNYIKAKKILRETKSKKVKRPRSPSEFFVPMYAKKMMSALVTTALGLVIIGELILNFDVISFISIMVTEISTVVIGLFGMLNTQNYLTDEYLSYAVMIEQESGEEPEGKKEC